MRLLRRLAVLALLLALLLSVAGSVHPLRLTHPQAAFRNALCLCPLCVVTDGLTEISWSEYC